MTYWALGCVQKCDLWALWTCGKEKKDRNFHASNWLFAQTTHVDIGPWNFACGVVSVSWKSVQGSRSCGGSKIALSHWQGPWLIQQLVLPYKPWYSMFSFHYVAWPCDLDLWPFVLESVSCTVLLVFDWHTNFCYPMTIGYWVTSTEFLITFPLSETVNAHAPCHMISNRGQK